MRKQDMSAYKLLAPCLFGLESILAGEVRRMGGQEVQVTDGRVTFGGGKEMIARANIGLRTAERVCVVLGSFRACSFTELFDAVEKLPFEQFIGCKDAFPVKGWSLKSGLHSIPDCQSIIKRAAVRRLEKVYGQSWFEETGAVRQIQFSILKDVVTVMLDTSGAGLHKRGYRKNANEAPLKETLAAGIVDLARVRGENVVMDPMCGSGTLLIESALRAFCIAPGVRRRFAAESWECIPADVWRQERERALEGIRRDCGFRAYGFDIDELAVTLTTQNAAKAGVGKRITAVRQEIGAFSYGEEKPIVFCNPPYGERLLEIREAEELYRRMGQVFPPKGKGSCYILSSHERFEEIYGRKADKRRKLYNGMIQCWLYMYFG